MKILNLAKKVKTASTWEELERDNYFSYHLDALNDKSIEQILKEYAEYPKFLEDPSIEFYLRIELPNSETLEDDISLVDGIPQADANDIFYIVYLAPKEICHFYFSHQKEILNKSPIFEPFDVYYQTAEHVDPPDPVTFYRFLLIHLKHQNE